MASAVTLRQLEYAVAIAETGSMTAAARTCHVSQSAVSLAVLELERAVGAQILLRGPGRAVSLTAAGQRLVVDARGVLAAVTDLDSAARSAGGDLAGPLTVGCYAPIAPFHLPVALAGFATAHPEVVVGFVEGSLEDLQGKLLEGRCELAFLYQQDLQPGIAVDVLYEQPPHALLPPSHPLTAGRAVTLAELAPLPMVLLDVPPSERYFNSIFTAAGLTMRVRYRAGTVELARALVARGLGYSLAVQRPVVNTTYDGGRVAVRPVADATATTPVVLARAAAALPTRRTSAFREHCRSAFRSGPPPPTSDIP